MLTGVLAFLALSCAETGCPTGGDRIELEAEMGEIRCLTRATPATSVHDAFCVWAWVWTDERTSPNYLCGERYTRTGTSTWKSELPHGSVLSPYLLQFWALSPADAPGLHGLPMSTTDGAPGFSYTTPVDPDAQTDLMAALSDVYEGMPPVVHLRFSHVLSCLQFSLDGDAPGTVVSLTVTNVCSDGRYRDGEGWTAVSAPDDFGMDGWQDCLLLIPQTLGSDAQLRITVEQGSGRQVLTASLAGMELPMGCRTIVRLTFPAAGSIALETSVSPWVSGPEFQE